MIVLRWLSFGIVDRDGKSVHLGLCSLYGIELL